MVFWNINICSLTSKKFHVPDINYIIMFNNFYNFWLRNSFRFHIHMFLFVFLHLWFYLFIIFPVCLIFCFRFCWCLFIWVIGGLSWDIIFIYTLKKKWSLYVSLVLSLLLSLLKRLTSALFLIMFHLNPLSVYGWLFLMVTIMNYLFLSYIYFN